MFILKKMYWMLSAYKRSG